MVVYPPLEKRSSRGEEKLEIKGGEKLFNADGLECTRNGTIHYWYKCLSPLLHRIGIESIIWHSHLVPFYIHNAIAIKSKSNSSSSSSSNAVKAQSCQFRQETCVLLLRGLHLNPSIPLNSTFLSIRHAISCNKCVHHVVVVHQRSEILLTAKGVLFTLQLPQSIHSTN